MLIISIDDEGFGLCGIPENLIAGLLKSGVKISLVSATMQGEYLN